MADYSFGEFTPIATRDDTGYISVEWPESAPSTCRMSRELLLKLVDDLNCLRGLLDKHGRHEPNCKFGFCWCKEISRG